MFTQKSPKISIVTPSFNQDQFLEETIKSVLGQEYPDLEYVIIDGGSSDNSTNIIRKYESKLNYWVSEDDAGHGDALNKGFSHTSGEIMAWLNSDDKYLPWTFKVVGEIFANFPDVHWITGYNGWWNSDGVLVKAKRVLKNKYDYLLGDFQWIQQESTFWRRSLWDTAGGHINQDYSFMVDGELWTRFFQYEDLYSVGCILGGYRNHETNRAKLNMDAVNEEMDKAISVMRDNMSQDIIDNSKRLSMAKKLLQKPLVGSWPMKKWLLHFCKNALECSRYDTIVSRDGGWRKASLPFL